MLLLLVVAGLLTTSGAAPRVAGMNACSGPLHGDADDMPVSWKGKATTLGELEDAVGAKAAEAVATWAPFAKGAGYGLHLSPDGRVLLVTRSERSALKKELDLIDRTIAFVDAMLPPSPPSTPSTPDAAPSPQSGPPRLPDPTDDETAVLIQARDTAVYGKVFDVLLEREPYLESWIPAARDLAGFILTRPLCACWIEMLAGQEEWNVHNELVHRLAHLLVARRFGELPYWMQLGIAWDAEESIQGGCYCFPYRNEFVFASEHGSWPSDLAQMFKSRKEPFFEDLVAWKRGTYAADQARQAFGLARLLALHHQDRFGAILRDLYELRATKGVTGDAKSWYAVPGFEPSAEDQAAVFTKHLGEDFLEQVVEYYRKGKKYRAPKG